MYLLRGAWSGSSATVQGRMVVPLLSRACSYSTACIHTSFSAHRRAHHPALLQQCQDCTRHLQQRLVLLDCAAEAVTRASSPLLLLGPKTLHAPGSHHAVQQTGPTLPPFSLSLSCRSLTAACRPASRLAEAGVLLSPRPSPTEDVPDPPGVSPHSLASQPRPLPLLGVVEAALLLPAVEALADRRWLDLRSRGARSAAGGLSAVRCSGDDSTGGLALCRCQAQWMMAALQAAPVPVDSQLPDQQVGVIPGMVDLYRLSASIRVALHKPHACRRGTYCT